jgi:S-adenosylmethionine synthetase
MDIYIGNQGARGVAASEVEIVERKGLGHPDTICDALAEELSIALSRFYLEEFGLILHHNVDKVLLWGGVSRPAFGGGEVIEPMEIFLAGRATLSFKGQAVPVDALARQACHRWVHEHFHALDPEAHVKVHCLVRPGSKELVDLYMRQRRAGVWLANDTSCGVGYAPLSDLERLVLAVERHLNAAGTKQAYPQIGQDIKVMGVRSGQQIDLTVACAMVGRYVRDLQAYLDAKAAVAALARKAAAGMAISVLAVQVNTADDPDSGEIYLTVTGTSAEAGDDGQAGRGNRANGVIAPYRPMTLEAVAGKNAVTHVGKLYNLAARAISEALVSEFGEVSAARCALVSRIGQPVDTPQIVDIEVATADERFDPGLRARIREITETELQGINTLWQKVIRGSVALY